ncbi:permease prefix domain 1-containing protein [Armatimonas sp.]|uniref:permease prefix domain 1-containing protein n=1 Tax=Armatimonas sp. TaxID=1872638 RepID=UPI00286AB50F|nr:permease prefix domain 1-containing protein [Armatimonas sp.]
MQNQRFEDDQAELEAHFAERVQAYLELGETPEQAQLSAREKFGDLETLKRQLCWQRMRRHPVIIGALAGLCWLATAVVLHLLTGWMVAPVLHERQPFPIGGTEGLLLLMRVYVTLAPAALLVVWKGGERFPRQIPALVLGILVFSVIPMALVPGLEGLILVPTLHGALIGWRLAFRARQEKKRV